MVVKPWGSLIPFNHFPEPSNSESSSQYDLEAGKIKCQGGEATVGVHSRIEVISDDAARSLFRLLHVIVVLCGGALATLAWLDRGERYAKNNGALLNTMAWANLVVAACCVLVMTLCLAMYLSRAWHLRYTGVAWSQRKRRWTCLQTIELTAQLMNSIVYLIPNVLIVGMNGQIPAQIIMGLEILRFTAWNFVFFLLMFQARLLNLWLDREHNPVESEDSILLDAPWSTNWILFLTWGGFEALILGHGWYHWDTARNVDYIGQQESVIQVNPNLVHSSGFCIFMFISYQVGALCFIQKGCNQLKKRSYAMFRWINVRLRYHHIQVLIVGGFVILSFCVLSWLQTDSRNMMVLNIFGLMPAQLVMVSLSAVNCYLMFPIRVEGNDRLITAPNRLSWLEKNQKSSESPCGQKSHFSFETMIKMWYWSLLAYRAEKNDPCIRFDVAKSMYGLSDHVIIRVKEFDITGIVAWGKSTIIIAFRGTSSLENVRTDLLTWLTAHPPYRGSMLRGTCPLVHKGFLKGWEASGLKEAVLHRVRDVIFAKGFEMSQARVILTGHSMGGALAVLAGLDISKECGVRGDKISCYTFGAPRIGNRAFKTEYNNTIQDTWQVANGDDMVPSVPKFRNFFTRVGERVIINDAGDIILCPLFVEKSITRFFRFLKLPTTWGDHLMRNYKKSIEAIIRAQFIKWKGLPGGLEAMRYLFMQGQSVTQVLDMKLRSLEQLHSVTSGAWQSYHSSPRQISLLNEKALRP